MTLTGKYWRLCLAILFVYEGSSFSRASSWTNYGAEDFKNEGDSRKRPAQYSNDRSAKKSKSSHNFKQQEVFADNSYDIKYFRAFNSASVSLNFEPHAEGDSVKYLTRHFEIQVTIDQKPLQKLRLTLPSFFTLLADVDQAFAESLFNLITNEYQLYCKKCKTANQVFSQAQGVSLTTGDFHLNCQLEFVFQNFFPQLAYEHLDTQNMMHEIKIASTKELSTAEYSWYFGTLKGLLIKSVEKNSPIWRWLLAPSGESLDCAQHPFCKPNSQLEGCIPQNIFDLEKIMADKPYQESTVQEQPSIPPKQVPRTSSKKAPPNPVTSEFKLLQRMRLRKIDEIIDLFIQRYNAGNPYVHATLFSPKEKREEIARLLITTNPYKTDNSLLQSMKQFEQITIQNVLFKVRDVFAPYRGLQVADGVLTVENITQRLCDRYGWTR